MDIIIDPNHGVNPSLSVCFWCGETESLILFGRLSPRLKQKLKMPESATSAPRHIIASSNPCSACIKFAEEDYVTIRCLNLTEEETERHGFIDSSGRINIDDDLEKIFKNLHPVIWRMKFQAFNKIFNAAVTDGNKFVFMSLEAVRAIGLPEEESPEFGSAIRRP